MGGKKPAAKPKAASAKASAKKEPEEEQPTPEQLEAKRLWLQRREASKWVQAQLTAVRGQLEAAQKRGNCDWLQAAHEFHEKRLIRLAKRLEEKALDGVPQELRDAVEAYLSQCASGPNVEQDKFEERREFWDLLDQDGDTFTRKPDSAEATVAIESIKAEKDAEAVAKIMRSHPDAPGVQEAGLTRFGGLFGQARDGADLPGLTCEALMPTINAGMRAHLPDPGVQRAGCAALRGLAMAPGQLPLMRDAGAIEVAVAALTAQYKDKEVALAANGAFWAMAQAAGKNSPEVATMRTAGVIDVMLKVMQHHAWDQTLVGKMRVVLPFIQED